MGLTICTDRKHFSGFSKYDHVIGFLDLIDLWVIKIKKPMILCTRSTSRSSDLNTKCRSSSKNNGKGLFIL